ncbi:hypothetical protein GCM10010218_04370 [Streptomyces mashuensis]|uniref:Uncharacterized protein n=1 Tax=Streptomyces mashuensis TaxID=33904 RepID=A0A919AUS1_9ACTN|nr:hypothetical protein [Streptomyces mashuensis]GHF26605.1 hypothetical protein GCM10010218_04370 [Streptomyces mashuensis]
MTKASDVPHRPWRPYEDEPLLTAAMADGNGDTPDEELARLREYLEALVAVRRAPVHVSVAFNAAYFGYDLAGEGYGVGPLDPDAFPVVTFGEHSPALPVGAMVRIATGSQPLYAEIVYKEGRHPGISPLGDVPAWISGAPAGAVGPGEPGAEDEPVRRELLVPDTEAFGKALSLSPAQLNRLRHHARWIDARGHVLVDAVHPSREAAQQRDEEAYAAYVLTRARQQLLSPYVPVSLTELAGGQTDALLQDTLLRLLAVVRGVLSTSDTLRMWGPYAMTCSDLAACWRDPGPLGGDDMGALVAALQRAAKPAIRRRYGMPAPTSIYTAVGPRLYDFPGAEPLLTGVGYAAAVCRANLALADVLRGESENGLFGNGTLVTLDDAFEGGGVWRSCHPGRSEPGDDPLTAAGRGWRSHLETPEAPVVDTPSAAPVDAPVDETGLGNGQLLRISDSEVAWRMPLRLLHLMEGYLPLRPMVADELRGVTGENISVRLELAHPGGELDESEEVQDTTLATTAGVGRLLGVEWPVDFFPGLELRLQWPRGGRVVRATTIPLENPVMLDEHLVAHQYDAMILTREGAPGSTRTQDSAVGLDPNRLVMRTVRRCGLLSPDGHALLDPSSLPLAVYGRPPAEDQVTALEAAVSRLLAEGELYAATGSRDADGRPHHPPRDHERRIPLIGYRPQPIPAVRQTGPVDQVQQSPLVTPHRVLGHVRRLRPGESPSETQRAAFRDHCRRLGKADGWELPPGYTFVTQHIRGH